MLMNRNVISEKFVLMLRGCGFRLKGPSICQPRGTFLMAVENGGTGRLNLVALGLLCAFQKAGMLCAFQKTVAFFTNRLVTRSSDGYVAVTLLRDEPNATVSKRSTDTAASGRKRPRCQTDRTEFRERRIARWGTTNRCSSRSRGLAG